MSLTDPQKRRATALWNKGEHGVTDISRNLGVSLWKVEAYLQSRPGFPDLIVTRENKPKFEPKREKIKALVLSDPTLSARAIAREINCCEHYAFSVKRDVMRSVPCPA